MTKLSALFTLLIFNCFGLKAQNLMVTLSNSTVETFPIANIQSIKFESSSMVLNELDGTINTWNIQDIDNYAFDGTSETNDLIEISKNNLTIFPNPSAGRVNILFESNEFSFISIEILDSKGNQVQQVYRGDHREKETYKWDSNVPDGVYYCRIITKNKTISKPVIIKK